MSLEAFIDAALYDPKAPGAGQRRELLEHLLDRGFTADQIIDASRRRDLITDVAQVLSRPGPTLLTLREIAVRCAASLDEVRAVRRALGFAEGGDDAADVPETFVEDFGLYRLACQQYGREPTLAFVRVLGTAVMTITEAARDLWTAELRESGATELQVSQANENAMTAWAALRDVVGHVMGERAARDMWFEAGLLRGQLTMAVGFVDLVGSTQWTENTSVLEHAAALGRFESVAAQLAAAHGGRVVKFIGDEVMIVASDPHAATTIAMRLCAAIANDASLPSARGAISYGPVTARSGDYFGPAVNLASRAMESAATNTVVVTTSVADKLDPTAWLLSDPRTVQLRGFQQPVGLVTVEQARSA
jgi:class 3 adenylate cyclase